MPHAIEWWVRRLAAAGVANLLVIPNHVDQKTKRCLTTTGTDMELIFERYGYKVRVRELRFKDPLVQSYGIAASLISLFELECVYVRNTVEAPVNGHAARSKASKPKIFGLTFGLGALGGWRRSNQTPSCLHRIRQ